MLRYHNTKLPPCVSHQTQHKKANAGTVNAAIYGDCDRVKDVYCNTCWHRDWVAKGTSACSLNRQVERDGHIPDEVERCWYRLSIFEKQRTIYGKR